MADARFLDFALNLDHELAEKTRKEGCSFCGAALHYARYQRKGWVGPGQAVPKGWGLFYGLCCAAEGCRKRTRPPSVRYAGRSLHSACLVLLGHLLTSGPSQRSVAAVQKELAVSERTLRRWLAVWRRVHVNTVWWRKLASLWSLSGQTVSVLYHQMPDSPTSKNPFEYMLGETAFLWPEITFTGGTGPPA